MAWATGEDTYDANFSSEAGEVIAVTKRQSDVPKNIPIIDEVRAGVNRQMVNSLGFNASEL